MRRLIFKSEQRFCFACKEQSLRKIAIVAGSISSSGFQWEIMTPTEIPKCLPPPMRWETSAATLYYMNTKHIYITEFL